MDFFLNKTNWCAIWS